MNTLTRSADLPTEKLPREKSMADELKESELTKSLANLSPEEIADKLEDVLRERIKEGDSQACFQLGQLLFEKERFVDAKSLFQRAVDRFEDYQAMFQLGVIYYDALGFAPSKENETKGFELMKRVAESQSPLAKHLFFAAAYNIGKAYFGGFGVKQSDEEALKWWNLAADDGNPRASILAQTTLGYMYCNEDHGNLEKAHFWHSEACGNGSLESQGALGIMHLYGLGVEKDLDAAYICLKEAAERGNVYAQGNLAFYYYQRKMYTKAAEIAAKVAQIDDVEEIAADTECLPAFIYKGISLASFVFARCLHKGHGVQQDLNESAKFYSKSFFCDSDVCAKMQNASNRGEL